jgi:hypothetical protein
VQPWHVPEHALSQHTPSTQKPLVHWLAAVHAHPEHVEPLELAELEALVELELVVELELAALVELDPLVELPLVVELELPPPVEPELEELLMLVPQSQAPHPEPSAAHVWPPAHAPGPTHFWVAPGAHTVPPPP